MANSREHDDGEWVEISDASGNRAALRHLGTVKFNDKTYYVLGAVKLNDDGEDEGGFVLVRQDQIGDAQQYVITSDEDEVENVIGRFIMNEIISQFGSADYVDDGMCHCGLPHKLGDFCYCDDPEFLQ